MSKARIKLIGKNPKELDDVCHQIEEIAKTTGVDLAGPIYLPTRRLKISTRRTPCGDGSDTYEHWEMRIHKRMIDILNPAPKVIEALTNIDLPSGVSIDVKML